jgi:hypothetical protein
MVGLPLLLSVALQAGGPAPRAAIYTGAQPMCDALGLSDEDGEVAARDLARDGEPMTAAGIDCELPDKPPAVVDCNDARASIWVHEMIGTCDMPAVFPHAALRAPLPRERGREPAALCEGPSCSRDAVPLRSAQPGSSGQSWMTLELDHAPPPPAPGRCALPESEALPPSAPLRLRLRPPMA